MKTRDVRASLIIEVDIVQLHYKYYLSQGFRGCNTFAEFRAAAVEFDVAALADVGRLYPSLRPCNDRRCETTAAAAAGRELNDEIKGT